jgi:D-alanyl-D-alanine dipeptidase
MKPYQSIPVVDCGEPLMAIPQQRFSVVNPPPYLALGAPYGAGSPYCLRTGVVSALVRAQQALQALQPGWGLHIFDAFRPLAVQQFMVDYTFQQQLQARGLSSEQLSSSQHQAIMAAVLQFWAIPSTNPATPPPHSTGAAVDLTLVDCQGVPVDMGSAIDELSPRSYPDHFAQATDPDQQRAHGHRLLLHRVMTGAGFRQHPQEWWHFSLGDQLWAWLLRQETGHGDIVAKYGGISP